MRILSLIHTLPSTCAADVKNHGLEPGVACVEKNKLYQKRGVAYRFGIFFGLKSARLLQSESPDMRSH